MCAVLDGVAAEQPDQAETDQIGEAVPAHGQRTEMHGNGIELRVYQQKKPPADWVRIVHYMRSVTSTH